MRSAIIKPAVAVLVIGLLASLLLVMLRHRSPSHKIASKPGPPAFQVVFHSEKLFGEVHVPLKLREGIPYINARIGGKKLECLLDTGDPYILWPASLHLTGIHSGRRTTVNDGVGIVRKKEEVTIANLWIGNYELHNAPTFAVERVNQSIQTGTHLVKKTGNVDIYANLGNAAFKNAVLTIDYRRQEIVLHRSDYDALSKKREGWIYVLPFVWSQDENGQVCHIIIRGKVAGHPANFTLDTGCAGVALNPHFAKKFLAGFKRRRTSAQQTAFGATNGMTIRDIELSLVAHFYVSDVALVDVGEADAIIGGALLQHFRVTIDYPRQRILLEPYSATMQ